MFKGIKRRHIDVDKSYIGMLKLGLAGGGEVAVARTDANDQISFFRERIGRRCARRADGTQAERMLVM